MPTTTRGFATLAVRDPERMREIARMGQEKSGGNFKRNPARASKEGRKGGLKSRRTQ
jgi:general stress protein YciG